MAINDLVDPPDEPTLVLPLELWRDVLDAVPSFESKWVFYSTCRLFWAYGTATYQGVLEALRFWWRCFKRDPRAYFWNPPYPSNTPEFCECLWKAAQTLPPVLFWKEVLANLPPWYLSDGTWGDVGTCNTKRALALRKKARQVRREIWNLLGRIARCRRVTREFKREFLKHAAQEPFSRPGVHATASIHAIRAVRKSFSNGKVIFSLRHQ